jgi:hypothetical protein
MRITLVNFSVVGHLNIRPINDWSWSFIGHVILINVCTFMNVRPMGNLTLYFFVFRLTGLLIVFYCLVLFIIKKKQNVS